MIFIITGPSGVGKNTIINELSNHIDFHFSTSYTTRPVSYTHLRAHETFHDLVCRLLLEKKIFLMIRRPPRYTP